MQLPSWLAGLTGAKEFANNPANGNVPTWGDAMQGIGHSMMENYRRTPGQPAAPSASQTPGVPGGGQLRLPQPQQAQPGGSNWAVGQAPDMRAVLASLMQAPDRNLFGARF